ncbi:aminoacetone oxidase family FAD-binding enzyme [Pacificimonas flava]|uniref:Aminoacetone oxidase family FAD-binding enzyme n=2 Tax=Pacificimonas TaxID=1960290 RepID=A0A219B5M3_9SPHN|nr:MULTISPECIES: NAD(P)/FAD-dependent oxidoreductase [Pacificimonas]MBZ6379113.1 NAD(P)/FAD-dependent oxidoreductase [Pacificimonas aurantium]OWV33655.1 aminoacetone oxidase family FAD-binding enzyme [Pacificimonas flava]
MTGGNDRYDAVVLGAGAAGLMCAARAAQRGARVLLADHNETPGRKILISGGGRCNFTNIHTSPDRFLSGNRHFAKSALSRYTARDFLALVEAYGIAWHEKTLGQLFCDGSARQIVGLLLEECRKGGVELTLGQPTSGVTRDEGGFTLELGGRSIRAAQLVVATGGPSIPKLGASSFAYEAARQFGLKVVEPRPALVPLTLPGEELLFRELSGVSSDVVASHGKTRFHEAALFTHRGLSGPAILQISSYWYPGDEIGIDFLPGQAPELLVERKRAQPSLHFQSALRGLLPDRLAGALCSRLGLSGDLGNLPDKALRGAAARLKDWRFRPSGSEGFAKAEVTVGGVGTAGLSSKTMEAKNVPGLYFIGEGVDVTGWLGGYNFQWAWASGVAAAEAVAERAAAA